MKQKDLIDLFIKWESEQYGTKANASSLARVWGITHSVISQYSTGTKEIPTWRLVWAMKRYGLKPGKVCDMLNEIYTPSILKKCYKNKAFSAHIMTL